MENAILEQIRSELSVLKERVAALERQLDEYDRLEAEPEVPVVAEPEEVPAEPGTPVEAAPAEPETAEPAEPEPVEPEPAWPEPSEPEPAETVTAEPGTVEPEPASAEPADIEAAPLEDAPRILEDPILAGPTDEAPIDLGIDLPDFGSGVKSINDVQSRKIHKRLMDSASSTPKWKTDLPGTPVRNIISAISLNDRVLMINKLFREDPQLFQQTLADLNAMSSFADAEDYINVHFGDWKMDSEAVYRFMMAVRRKLNA